jgi:hypothetical protein
MKITNITLLEQSKNNKYHTVGTVQKYNRKIVDRGKIVTAKTHTHDRSLSWLGKDTSIKSCGVRLVLWTLTSTRSE